MAGEDDLSTSLPGHSQDRASPCAANGQLFVEVDHKPGGHTRTGERQDDDALPNKIGLCHQHPGRQDVAESEGQPRLRGFQSNLVFFDHKHPEKRPKMHTHRAEQRALSVQQNVLEAEMVVSCVRYLRQQHYKASDILVVTPQRLPLLSNKLRMDRGPISDGSAEAGDKAVRFSTMDKVQVEDGDIVVVSLARSKRNRDIGFTPKPGPLAALLSRGRNPLIMIGNAATFTNG
ncbi:hypothetical protein GGR56DRAFT_346006 [Xylariaceae sp. FL0804]|nr:hypothetical protein GGR56DRAFT_346006 [Xylariaceae sp. FL0804]